MLQGSVGVREERIRQYDLYRVEKKENGTDMDANTRKTNYTRRWLKF